MCRYNFPRGKAAPTVPPAIQRNEILMLHEWRMLARTVSCTRTSRAQGRGIIVVHSLRMCVRPLKIRWKGKKRTRYLHILRGCGKSSTCMRTRYSPRHTHTRACARTHARTHKIEYIRTVALSRNQTPVSSEKRLSSIALRRGIPILREEKERERVKNIFVPCISVFLECTLLHFALHPD